MTSVLINNASLSAIRTIVREELDRDTVVQSGDSEILTLTPEQLGEKLHGTDGQSRQSEPLKAPSSGLSSR